MTAQRADESTHSTGSALRYIVSPVPKPLAPSKLDKTGKSARGAVKQIKTARVVEQSKPFAVFTAVKSVSEVRSSIIMQDAPAPHVPRSRGTSFAGLAQPSHSLLLAPQPVSVMHADCRTLQHAERDVCRAARSARSPWHR